MVPDGALGIDDDRSGLVALDADEAGGCVPVYEVFEVFQKKTGLWSEKGEGVNRAVGARADDGL